MSKSRYVQITQDEFHDFMESNQLICINDDQAHQELMYATMWNEGYYSMRIYSSIVPNQSSARAVGQDAIRTVLFIWNKEKEIYIPIWKAPRVYRTINWRKNLQNKIDGGLQRGLFRKDYQCKKCGALMVPREGKASFFFGCSMFPTTRCNYTMSNG
jgi:hypothetical protein